LGSLGSNFGVSRKLKKESGQVLHFQVLLYM
jgi:hypothetical protein